MYLRYILSISILLTILFRVKNNKMDTSKNYFQKLQKTLKTISQTLELKNYAQKVNKLNTKFIKH